LRAVVAPDRRRHILDGDATGGGHRGSGRPGSKSRFPVSWDDDRIVLPIEKVANDPKSRREPAARGRMLVYGFFDGIGIAVVVGSDGRTTVTAFPWLAV
jgi:hypothetical protein